MNEFSLQHKNNSTKFFIKQTADKSPYKGLQTKRILLKRNSPRANKLFARVYCAGNGKRTHLLKILCVSNME